MEDLREEENCQENVWRDLVLTEKKDHQILTV
jgi:hypothetical protein